MLSVLWRSKNVSANIIVVLFLFLFSLGSSSLFWDLGKLSFTQAELKRRMQPCEEDYLIDTETPIFVFLCVKYCQGLLLYILWNLLAIALRKHAYSNIVNILPPKNKKNQIKKFDILHIFAQNIDCGYPLEPPRGGDSNAYPKSMFLSRNVKNNVYPCKTQFYYIKVEFKESKLYRHIFVTLGWLHPSVP